MERRPPREFRILGPLEVAAEGCVVRVPGAQRRTLLGLLLLRANATVSDEELAEELWPERRPPSARAAIQVHVSELRKLLGVSIMRRESGYALLVDRDEVDALRFADVAHEGAQALDAGDAQTAAAMLRDALRLWRGGVLEGLELDASVERARLEELRTLALERRIEAELALSAHAQLVPELRALVAREPLRERFRAQLMLALYRCGRQTDALRVYEEGRRLLVSELGIEPGSELRRLERQILEHDPPLAAPQPTAGTKPRRRTATKALLALAGGALMLATATGAVFAMRPERAPLALPPNSVAVLDAEDGDLRGTVRVGKSPVSVAFGAGAAWVANSDDNTLARIDPERMRVTRTIGLESRPADVAVGGGSVWVLCAADREVLRIDPRTNQVVATMGLPDTARSIAFAAGPPLAIAAGDEAVWVTMPLLTVARIDLRTNELTTITAEGTAGDVAVGEDAVWVGSGGSAGGNIITRVDTGSGSLVTTPVRVGTAMGLAGRKAGYQIAASGGAVWFTDSEHGVVWVIDPAASEAVGTIEVGRSPSPVAASPDAVWVGNQVDHSVSQFDPTTRRVVRTVELGRMPQAIAAGAGSAWIVVR